MIHLVFLVSYVLADWPQFRGPARDGSVVAMEAPTPWPATASTVWKVDVGTGYSSPVTAGGTAFVHSRKGVDEVVTAIDVASGKTLWSANYAAPFKKNQYATSMQDGPFATPAVAGGRLFTWGAGGVLSCFDAMSGRVIWRHALPTSTAKLFTGHAASPLVDGSRVIVYTGDDGGGALTAYDAATGKTAWHWKGDGPGYASPVIATIGGLRQVITLTAQRVVSVDAASGTLLWAYQFKDEWNENIITPVIHGSRVIVSGVRAGTAALEPKRVGGSWSVETAWKSADVAFYMSNPVLGGDHLYGMSAKRKGQFVCLDARTGVLKWSTNGRDADQASLTRAGMRLFIVKSDGEMIVAKLSPAAFEVETKVRVAESAVWAQPVFDGRRVLVKGETTVALLQF